MGWIMFIYECDFINLKEDLYNDANENNEKLSTPLGTFICQLLSTDFEKAAFSISSFLCEQKEQGEGFPAKGLEDLVNTVCSSSAFDNMRDMISILGKIYKRGESHIMCSMHGGLKSAFTSEIYEKFKIGVILQAYLEGSEQSPEMTNPNNFERFVSGELEVQIIRNQKAYSLNEHSIFEYIYPGCDALAVVKDIFGRLCESNDAHCIFYLTSLDEFLVSVVYSFFSNGFIFKRCRNCGCFFVPFSRSDELYCNNISPQDKTRTCKEYGSQKLWYERIKNDEAAKLARNIYSAKQMLVRRNPDISAYKDMFEYFKRERKKWEVWIHSGEKSKREYIDWLNEMKSKRTL